MIASPIILAPIILVLISLGIMDSEGSWRILDTGVVAIAGMFLVFISVIIALIDAVLHRSESELAKIVRTSRPLTTMEKAIAIAIVLIVISLCFTYFRITPVEIGV